MRTINQNTSRSNPVAPPVNPYIGQPRDPRLARILEGAAVAAAPANGEQDDDGGDEGEDDDIRSGGDYGVPAGYICGNRPPPLLRVTNSGGARPVLLGSFLPPPPSGTAIATVAGGGDDDMPPTGVYDGLAKLAPNTIVDKTYLAKMFDVSEKTIRRRVHAGELPPPCTRMRRQPQWMVGVLLDSLNSKARHIAGQEEARRQRIRDKTETEPNN